MPDASKNGNPSAASNSKNSSVAGVSSEIERQQRAAAAYDGAEQRTAGNAEDFSRHVEMSSSDYSAGSNPFGTTGPSAGSTQDVQHATLPPNAANFNAQNNLDTFGSSFGDRQSGQDAFKAGMNTGIDQLGQSGVARSSEFDTDMTASVQADAHDAFSSSYDAGRTGFDQLASAMGQGFDQPQQVGFSVAAQPIQQVPSAFISRMEQQVSGGPFADGAARRAAAQQNMMTSIDGVDAAGIAGSRDFIEGTAVSVQADARDAFSGAYDTGRTGFDQPAGDPGQNPGSPQAGQQSFGGFSPMAGANASAEDKAVSVSEAVGFGAKRSSSASWVSTDMFSGGPAKDVHLSKKIQENLDNSKAAYVQAKQDFAAAEKGALEMLDASGWSSGNQASAFSDSAARAEGFKDGLGTSADGIERAGLSDSLDFGFMTQTEREAVGGAAHGGKPRGGDAAVSKYSDAPDSVRSAARKVVTEKENVRKASDEMVTAHREASEFITKAEQRAKTAANFKSAATNALVNSAVTSIGDDSVSGTAIRSSARAAVAAGRSIKASRAAGKQVGARGFFSSSAEAAKSAVFAFDEEGSLDGLEKADEAVRTGRYIRGKAKDFNAARAKAKGGSKSQLMSQAEKKAARASEEGQRAAFSKSMQRRSMSIAKAKATAGEITAANEKANLISKLVSGLANAGKQALQSLAAIVQDIGSFLSGLFGSIAAALGSSVFAIIAVVVLLIILFVVALFCDPSQATVQGLNETETQVATFFREKGLDDVQIAAIMGNMYGESGMNAGSEEGGGTNANGIGLCQWTNGRHTNLVNYANSIGKSWTDVGVQLDFFWDHDKWQTNWWSGYHINTYDHSPESMSEDPPSGSYVEGSKKGFLAATDVKDAVRQFLYGWEVAGIPRLKVRYDAAERYLEALQNGGDADGDHGANGGAPQIAGATARQQAIVNSAYATPTAGQGRCAAWVSNVFRNAGYGFYGGNACDMCRSWCHSSNRNELKVGMIIADVSHPGTGTAGLTYGHVGIYIGNNKVMSNEGPITVKSLDAFIRFYGAGTGCRWGWLGGIDLSQ